MDEKTLYFQIRMTPAERAELRRLAAATGRTRANVIRSLIRLAAADPYTLRALGELPQPQPAGAQNT